MLENRSCDLGKSKLEKAARILLSLLPSCLFSPLFSPLHPYFLSFPWKNGSIPASLSLSLSHLISVAQLIHKTPPPLRQKQTARTAQSLRGEPFDMCLQILQKKADKERRE